MKTRSQAKSINALWRTGIKVSTGNRDKNGTMIMSTDKLIDENGEIYTIWHEVNCGWLIQGSFLSGDDLSIYADRLEVMKER